MKNILLLVHDDAGQEARFQAALDLVRAISGHLTCLDVTVIPEMIGDPYTPGADAMLIADEYERETENRARIEARLSHEDISWNWQERTGSIASSLEKASTLTELIVVNRQLDSFRFPDMRAAAAELIVAGRKPILAVPELSRGIDVSGRALVAWDGSAQADAALQAALPLLARASEVTLLQIDDGSVKVPAEDAAAFLSRHGIHPALVHRDRVRDVSDIILKEVDLRHINYLVMGAFGRSRFIEALFGGITRRMLTTCPVPLFLAH